jgi:hypothetical protein
MKRNGGRKNLWQEGKEMKKKGICVEKTMRFVAKTGDY